MLPSIQHDHKVHHSIVIAIESNSTENAVSLGNDHETVAFLQWNENTTIFSEALVNNSHISTTIGRDSTKLNRKHTSTEGFLSLRMSIASAAIIEKIEVDSTAIFIATTVS